MYIIKAGGPIVLFISEGWGFGSAGFVYYILISYSRMNHYLLVTYLLSGH